MCARGDILGQVFSWGDDLLLVVVERRWLSNDSPVFVCPVTLSVLYMFTTPQEYTLYIVPVRLPRPVYIPEIDCT